MIKLLKEKHLLLLKHREKDATVSIKRLADKLNISPSNVSNTIKMLKAWGYIISIRAVVNHPLMGNSYTGRIDLNLGSISEESIERFTKDVIAIAGPCDCYHRDGEYNIHLVIITKDTDTFFQILQRLTSLSNVKNYRSFNSKQITMPEVEI